MFGHESVESLEQVFQCLLELRHSAVFVQFHPESLDMRESVEVEGLVGVGILGLALL